jgi:hypothetical protein
MSYFVTEETESLSELCVCRREGRRIWNLNFTECFSDLKQSFDATKNKECQLEFLPSLESR